VAGRKLPLVYLHSGKNRENESTIDNPIGR